jgi:hypothetical protein
MQPKAAGAPDRRHGGPGTGSLPSRRQPEVEVKLPPDQRAAKAEALGHWDRCEKVVLSENLRGTLHNAKELMQQDYRGALAGMRNAGLQRVRAGNA